MAMQPAASGGAWLAMALRKPSATDEASRHAQTRQLRVSAWVKSVEGRTSAEDVAQGVANVARLDVLAGVGGQHLG